MPLFPSANQQSIAISCLLVQLSTATPFKMKKIFTALFLISFFLSGFTYAQEAYFKISFADKQSSYDISRPADFLSEKSIERRILQQIPINDSDKPLSPEYLDYIKASGGQIVYQSKWLNMVIVKSEERSFSSKMGRKPYVKSVEAADYLYAKHVTTRNKFFFENEKIEKIPERLIKSKQGGNTSNLYQYGLGLNQVEMIGIQHLHNMGYAGAGIVIGVIDGGFNNVNFHPAFDSLWQNGQILGTRDFVQPGNDVYANSMSTHGTMVLSTMGANLPGQFIGTAPKASYWLMRSEDTNGEYLLEEYYWVNAAEFADSVGVDIINSSLGYSFFDNPAESHRYEDMDGNTTPITIGADMAAAKGILVVSSAGNSGGNPEWPYITAPSDGDSVFTIGAVNGNREYVYFSSIGPTFDGRIKPDVMAQGMGTTVVNASGGIASGNGTSFSSPIMAGAAASLWQANPTMTNMDLMNAIKATASKSNNPDNLMGWGIPDFLLANTLLTTNLIQISNPIKELKVFPNPFTRQLNIEVDLPKSLKADIRLFNSHGQTVANLLGVDLAQGKNLLVLDQLSKLPSGIYMLQVTDGYYSITEKVVR